MSGVSVLAIVRASVPECIHKSQSSRGPGPMGEVDTFGPHIYATALLIRKC